MSNNAISRRKRLDFGDFFALAYLVFFFLEPLARRSASFWLESLGILCTFLALWFGFIYSRSSLQKRSIIAVLALLGGAVIPRNNAGGACFLIYVASLIPYAFSVLPWQLGLIGADLFLMYGLERWQHFPLSAISFTLFFAVVGGGANLFFAEKERTNCKLQRKQEEIEALAAVAERERIARDLHDVLGHTLSVIVLKSELANRLLERHLEWHLERQSERQLARQPERQPSLEQLDPETLRRACTEIADVERTARTALAEVREAIGGYRARALGAEIEAARQTLATAGVTLTTEGELRPAALSAAEETVFALALREAVTNIVRHAEASTCRLRLVEDNGRHRLSIEDNGRHPTAAAEGNGLRGMRERVEALGGQFSLTRRAGTQLQIELPVRTA